MDDKQRVALVETRTLGDDDSPEQLVRYQFGNHLGSASLELDDTGSVISYEEYTPYGSTSFQAVDRNIKAAAKRYRYTGKERDEETGFSHSGARHYASWVGSWISCDPAALAGGISLYRYANNRPLMLTDWNGLWPSLADVNKNLERVNRAAGLLVGGPTLALVTGLIDSVGTKATEAVTGQAAPQEEGDAPKALSGAQRAESGVDAVIATTPLGPLNATSKAAGKAIGDTITGKARPLDALKRGDPTGMTALTFETAESVDKAEIAINSGDTGGAVGATVDVVLNFGDLVMTGVNLVEGARGAIKARGPGKSRGGNKSAGGGKSTAPKALPTTYTVLAEAPLPEQKAKGDRASHKAGAEAGLKAQVDAQRDVYKSPYRVNAIMDIIDVKEPTGAKGPKVTNIPLEAPEAIKDDSIGSTAWHHHPFKEGLMQLVYRAQHQASEFQHLFHPGRKGGFTRWLRFF
jgi:RHS repeat-associated protein